jgi:hypothetical protein
LVGRTSLGLFGVIVLVAVIVWHMRRSSLDTPTK